MHIIYFEPKFAYEEFSTDMNNNINPADFSILIVDDNATNTILLDAILKREKYKTMIARSGEMALQIMQEKHPDLVLLDIMMPEMDGYETALRKSEIESIRDIPFLFVTALSDTTNMVKGFKAGCSDFISKPFNTEELQMRVEKLLEGRRLLQMKYAQNAIERKDDEKQDASQSDSADMRFLTKVSDIVYMQLSRNRSVDVAMLASNLCMSSRQLHRKMVTLTGLTPIAYIQRIKIKKAKTLLDKNPQMNFNEVADQSGFGDYSNFVRAFKNVCGVTPTEYRRRESM